MTHPSGCAHVAQSVQGVCWVLSAAVLKQLSDIAHDPGCYYFLISLLTAFWEPRKPVSCVHTLPCIICEVTVGLDALTSRVSSPEVEELSAVS
jgi:hypothetical protein